MQTTSEYFPPLFLQAGKISDDFNVTMILHICYLNIFCEKARLTASVLPFSDGNISSLKQKLELSAEANDASYLAQVSAALVVAYDEQFLSHQDFNQVQLHLLNGLDTIVSISKMRSGSELEMLSEVLQTSLRTSDNFSYDALVTASVVMKQLGADLQKIALQKDVSFATTSLTNVAEALLHSASNLVGATVTNSSYQVKELLQTQFEQYKPLPNELSDLSPREVYFQEMLYAKLQEFQNIQSVSARKTVLGNIITVANSITAVMTEMKLSVANRKSSLEDSNVVASTITVGSTNKSLSSTDAGSTLVLENADAEQDVEIVALKSNPFIFDESGLLVNSGVVQMKTSATSQITNKFKFSNMRHNEKAAETIKLPPNVASASRFEIHSLDSAALIYAIPSDQSSIRIWIRKDKQPILTKFSDDPDITMDVADFTYQLPKSDGKSSRELYSIFIPSALMNDKGTYFISMENTLGNGRSRRSTNNATSFSNSTTEISVEIYAPSCKSFDATKGSWSGSVCLPNADTDDVETVCDCPYSSQPQFIGAEFSFAPNFIDFSSVFSKVDLINNGAVFFTITAFMVMFILLLLWARREDKRDLEKWSTKVMEDNALTDSYFYKISIITGLGSSAGTFSNVYFVLGGEESQTKIRLLRDASHKKWFERGSVVHFLMSVPHPLGNLDFLRIWHDNSGDGRNGGNWFLSEAVVQDLHQDKTYFFTCNKWLAVEKGDGKIERLLPVAGEENLSSYRNIFSKTARERLTDGHIWFSVFVNRSFSNFTRCQRLACAITALFLAMISNAMFYESPSDPEDNSESFLLKVGPLIIDPRSLWISAVTVLVVLPPTVVLVQIFRKTTKKKTSVSPGSMSIRDHTSESAEASHPKMLPYWVVYVGWGLVFVAIVSSGFFTILYSFQWGKEKSEHWLSSMMLSFFQDNFLVQPLKVLAISALFAVLCRRSFDLHKSWKEQSGGDVIVTPPTTSYGLRQNLPSNVESEANGVVNLKSYKQSTFIEPPQEADVLFKKIRDRRLLEKNSVLHFTDFTLYVIYLGLLFYIAYHGHQDYQFFQTKLQLHRLVAGEDFQELTNTEDLWDYLENSLVPVIFSTHKYNGKYKLWRERVFLDDDSNYRVGPIRLRQLRSMPDFCDTYKIEQHYRSCVDDYLILNEDDQDYNEKWTEFNDSLSLEKRYWLYVSSSTSDANAYLGQIALYSGGGYIADLGANIKEATQTLQYLKDSLWIDRSTRSIFIEFTVYNANSNTFATVILLAEFITSGGCVTTTSINPFRLYQLENSFNLFVACIFATFFVLLFTARSAALLVKKKCGFFKKVWNYCAVVRIVLFLSYAGLNLYSYTLQSSTLEDFQENTYMYHNFQSLATLSSALRELVGFILFFETIQVLEYLKYLKQMRNITLLFVNGRELLAEFICIFLLHFLAYSLAALLLFSVYLRDYQTFIKTVLSLWGGLLGSPIYSDLNNKSPIMGKIFYSAFGYHMTFILLNFVIGVIDAMLHSANQERTEKINDGRHAYFQIAIGLLFNFIRRIFKMKEKEIPFFKNSSKPEDSEDYKDDAETTYSNKPSRNIKHKRRNRRRRRRRFHASEIETSSITAEVCDKIDERQLHALRRLAELEKAIDSVDISMIKCPVQNPKSRKENVAAEVLDEVDVIFSEIQDELLHL